MRSTQLNRLRDDTIAFLRQFGRLDEPDKKPTFRGKGFSDSFRKTYFGLNTIYEWEWVEALDSVIPDSEEFVVMDIGSGLGRRVTRLLAAAKPKTRFYMVDKLSGKEVSEGKNYKKEYGYPGLKIKVKKRDNVEEWVNDLMQANGFSNITYVDRKMVPLEPGKGNLESIEDTLKSRRLVFTGYDNPYGLGNITASEIVYHKPEMAFFNNSALEAIKQDSPHWNLTREFLSGTLTEKEIDKIISLIHDPNYDSDKMSDDQKYDYWKEGQRHFAMALKQLFVLAQVNFLQKHDMRVTLYHNEQSHCTYGSYNGADHNIYACTKSVRRLPQCHKMHPVSPS
jgi:hypothetical protein